MTLVGAIASFFLPWYDDPASYTETYAIEGLFDILISCIRWMTVVSGVLTVILVIVAAKVEPRQRKAVALN
jgi:hypothetical protein